MTESSTMTEPCRFIALEAENFLRLRAVAIRPAGNVVEITGDNGSGKTSCLRAFWAALEGKAALAGIAPVAVKRGTAGGSLHLDLGRVQITRTITPDGDGGEEWTLKLVADGRRITSKPQSMLDAIMGDGLALDPLEFTRWDAKRQADTLKRLVPGFDFDENEKARAEAFADRTDANREAKRARAAADSIILPDGPEPDIVDTVALMSELDRATMGNADIAARVERRAQAQRDIDAKLDEAEGLRVRAATLEKEADLLAVKLKDAPALPAPVDTAPIRARIAAADGTRAARALFSTKRIHKDEASREEDRAEFLTEKIAALDQAKAAAITKAKLPVEGLALGEDVVLLDGLPFSQASTAKKIRTSMAIAMATAGDLKVIMIDEGSELDGKSLALVEGMVKDTPFVVMICRVDESGERGWVIQDGAVVRTPKARATP